MIISYIWVTQPATQMESPVLGPHKLLVLTAEPSASMKAKLRTSKSIEAGTVSNCTGCDQDSGIDYSTALMQSIMKSRSFGCYVFPSYLQTKCMKFSAIMSVDAFGNFVVVISPNRRSQVHQPIRSRRKRLDVTHRSADCSHSHYLQCSTLVTTPADLSPVFICSDFSVGASSLTIQHRR